MDQILLNSILTSAIMIDLGRKGLKTDGGEREGRLSFEKGIMATSIAFSQVQSSANPQTILLAEEAFIEQELKFCSEKDTYSRSSLTQAIQSFDDAFLCLEAVEDANGYKTADKTWPHSAKYRVRSFPKDAFHIACIAHRTRLQNILRSPGIDMTEKAVLEQRIANMTSAQMLYTEKQKKTLQ